MIRHRRDDIALDTLSDIAQSINFLFGPEVFVISWEYELRKLQAFVDKRLKEMANELDD